MLYNNNFDLTNDVIENTLLEDSKHKYHIQEIILYPEFLLQILHGISDPVFVKDRQHNWVFLNDAYCRFIGFQHSELIGKSDYDIFPEKQADRLRQQDEIIFTTGIANETEESLTNADGVTCYLLIKKSRFEDGLGNHFLVGIIRDITQEKLREAKLCASQQILQQIIDNIPLATYWKNSNSVYLGCNQQFTKIIGRDHPNQIIGKTDYDLMQNQDNLNWFWESDFQVIESKQAEYGIVKPYIQTDGKQLWLETNKIPLKDHQQNFMGILVTCQDITARKQVEQARLRSHAILQAQQEASIDGILIIDENRLVASYNQNFAELWQIPPAILETGDDRQLLGWVLDQLKNPTEFLAKVEYLYQHPEELSFDEILLKSGQTFDRYSAPVRCLTTSRYASTPVDDYYGRIWYFRDITERKQAEAALLNSEARLRQQAQKLQAALRELQQTQIQLVQSEKMSSLGQLVAGVAHEINNPVNFIYGNLNHANIYTQDLLRLLELYQKYYPQPLPEIEDFVELIELDFLRSDLPQILKSMQVGANRIREIVLSLRTFSRLDEADMKEVEIHEGIDCTLMILQSRLKLNNQMLAIEVIKEYGNLPLIECYSGQLNQVLMNVLANAIDALEDSVNSGQWSKEKLLSRENPQIRIQTELIETNQVKISIADNGSGIPENIQQQIFDPFFTTKPVGKGTGMGLAISYQIVTKKHGGSLECISQPGEGTKFVITIPLSQKCKIVV